jgi:hypothetical protein
MLKFFIQTTPFNSLLAVRLLLELFLDIPDDLDYFAHQPNISQE